MKLLEVSNMYRFPATINCESVLSPF